MFLPRLYLVLEESVSSGPSLILQSLGLNLLDFNVIDLELSPKALESHLLKHTVRVDHPEYAIRHRALLVDCTFYRNQMENSQVHDSKWGIFSSLINWSFYCRRRWLSQ